MIDFQDAGIITTALTAAGAPIWAGIIQGIIQVLKSVPQFKTQLDGREKLMCFLLALAVVVIAFMASLQQVPPQLSLDIVGIVTMVLAWFTVARLSMAFYDDFISRESSRSVAPAVGDRPSQSLLSSDGWNGEPEPVVAEPVVEQPVVVAPKPRRRKPPPA